VIGTGLTACEQRVRRDSRRRRSRTNWNRCRLVAMRSAASASIAGAQFLVSPNAAIPAASSSEIGPTATVVTRTTVTGPASSVSWYSVSSTTPGDRRPRVAHARGGSKRVTWP
jgi:hypothetical protein